jgi:hypothetical protein
VLRVLAVTGVAHVVFFVSYTVPNTVLAPVGTGWPQDLRDRSYLTDFVCGIGTQRPCPGSAVR